MGVTVREEPKGSGIWYVFINHQGQRKSKKIGSKRSANLVADQIRVKLAEKTLHIAPEKKEPFYQYARSHLDTFVQVTRSSATYTRYSGLLEKYLKKHLGSKPLQEITRGEIRNMLLAEYKKGSSKSSISLMLCVVSGVFQAAMDDEIVKANPCSTLTLKLGLNKDQKEINPLSQEEVNTVLYYIDSQYRSFFFTAFRTGARIGELCALQWGDVDFRKKTLTIRRTAKDQKVKESTKTYSRRVINMSNELVELLKEEKKADKKICFAAGKPLKWIFHKGEKLFAQNTIRRVWARALDKAGISHRRFHDIRHTTASLLLSRGAPLVAVSRLLGHTNPNITLSVYAHYMPSENQDITNLLDSKELTEYKVDADTCG